jgi:large subunit ribosomal protein L25
MTATLKAEPRKQTGSRHARRLRGEGRIPATVQGGGVDHLDVSIEAETFLSARRAHEHVFELDLFGELQAAVVEELQWDTFGDNILHVEFRRVNLKEKTEAEVELEFVGHPKGGQLNHLLTHVTILAIPTLIPDSIEVPVDGLDVGDQVRASDLKLPEGVELGMPGETAVAVISAVRAEPLAAPAPEASEVPKVEAAPAPADEE